MFGFAETHLRLAVSTQKQGVACQKLQRHGVISSSLLPRYDALSSQESFRTGERKVSHKGGPSGGAQTLTQAFIPQ